MNTPAGTKTMSSGAPTVVWVACILAMSTVGIGVGVGGSGVSVGAMGVGVGVIAGVNVGVGVYVGVNVGVWVNVGVDVAVAVGVAVGVGVGVGLHNSLPTPGALQIPGGQVMKRLTWAKIKSRIIAPATPPIALRMRI
jgi:hypothetical protein